MHHTRSTAWATASGGTYAALLRLSDRYRCARALLGEAGEEAREEGVGEAILNLAAFDVSGREPHPAGRDTGPPGPHPRGEVTRLSREEASLRQSARRALKAAAGVVPGAGALVWRVEAGAAGGRAEHAVAAFGRGSPTALPASTSPKSLRLQAVSLLEAAVAAANAQHRSQDAVDSVARSVSLPGDTRSSAEPQNEGALRRSIEQAIAESGVAQPTARAVLQSQRCESPPPPPRF